MVTINPVNPVNAITAINAVLFDLDDTLFGQVAWLDQAWRHVAGVAGAQYDVDESRFLNALRAVCAEGSDKGRIIDRALERVDATHVPVAPLVEAFRSLDAPVIVTYPGVKASIARLRERVKVGLVSDGDPPLQLGKLEALGLEECFDTVVLSDELGPSKSMRKPHPAPFLVAAEAFGVKPANTVYIGDRPDKDVAGAHAARMRAIRVRTGEYRKVDGDEKPWRDVPHAVAAVAVIEQEMAWTADVVAAGGSGGGDR